MPIVSPADPYAILYQTIDDVCAAEARIIPPGSAGSVATVLYQLRCAGAPEPAIRKAEAIALTFHRMQQTLAARGRRADRKFARMRRDLGRMGAAWLQDAPIVR